MSEKLDCECLPGGHSTDRITVWHGALLPLRMCGRHATDCLNAETIRQMRNYRASWTPETGWKEPYT